MPLEGQEVPQRAGPDGGEQPGVRDGPLRAGRRAGLDERDHVAGEADVDDRGRRRAARPARRRRPGRSHTSRADLLYCVDDLHVAAAAAQVAAEGLGDLLPGRPLGLRAFGQEGPGREDHAGDAVAALEGVVAVEGLHDGVVVGHTLDGGDRVALREGGEQDARRDRLPVEQHGARPAQPDPAGASRAEQAEPVAQHLEQHDARLDVDSTAAPVDLQDHVHEASSAQPQDPFGCQWQFGGSVAEGGQRVPDRRRDRWQCRLAQPVDLGALDLQDRLADGGAVQGGRDVVVGEVRPGDLALGRTRSSSNRVVPIAMVIAPSCWSSAAARSTTRPA